MDKRAFAIERDRTYDAVLAVVSAQCARLPRPALLWGLQEFSSAGAREGAELACWQLYATGITHLKNGAPQGRPGSLAEAVARASVRNAPLAAGLGIRPPVYHMTAGLEIPPQKTGRLEALFHIKRMIEASLEDLGYSRRIISGGLAAHNPVEAFGVLPPPVGDPELERIARAASMADNGGVNPADIAALRKQMVLSFNALMDAYVEAGTRLRRELDNLK